MKRPRLIVFLLLIIAVVVFIVVTANIEHLPRQKEYLNQKCPKEQNGNDDFLFFHPLNRLIATL